MPKNLILKNVYRNGDKVPMAFRNGELIYQMVTRLVFNVDTNSLSFDSSGNSTTITITANDKWTMTVPNWITASALSGTTGATITLTASATGDNRDGQIVISCEGKTHTIEVEQAADYSKMYLTIEANESGSLTLAKAGVDYSINNDTWSTSTAGQQLSLSSGDKVRFKCTVVIMSQLETLFAGNTLSCKAYGNVMSLNDGDNFQNSVSFSFRYALSYLFANFSGLTDASNVVLPATSLTNYCYNYMFYNCKNLVYGPKELPATTLNNYCYQCMFSGCSKLLSAPYLPAPTLVSYCYYRMFLGCSVLNYIKCLATSVSASNSHSNWVNGVQTTSGTFVKSPYITTSTWGSGASGIPNGWTVLYATT